MNLYTRIHPWGTAAGSATEYAAAARREVLEWLVGACPECGGSGLPNEPEFDIDEETCPVCGGVGLDLTELVEAGAVVLGFKLGHTFASIAPPKAGPNTERITRAVVAELLRVLGRET